MAAITKSGTPSLSSATPPPNNRLSGLYAGEVIAAGDACVIKNDGKIYRASGAANDGNAVVDGFAATSAAPGESLSLYWGVNFNYGKNLTPGTSLYLSGTVPGGLDTAPSTGGTTVIGRVVDSTRIYVQKSY
ncbi:hypothetical protein EI42_06005 [Thermosporothrix hazakensis]|jgi:hypothetical protein|uniref:Uncharacterized protein n=2 Tax=Thermosporothrix TaxID=768650 RepID=A0A326TUF2_THEHA|nr:hypothetical protein [Thermosporothrix hazakensis]BBH90145.1 hypothetical protein KTC_48960 [Thermosporothrix sp. COM3]PZW19696.1 hypothetical protein EI42_06005 [Thermosporothrix hazakensis]BBH90210.1 hypothetical protein KTC_49610 [Thermosporothrix sp. COM3]BBH90275.1 hypothetical protein KTC_50260 [Thermosporothrix sp. COM3]GCE49192.1 hypothetical protein KTH_40610 [Thermosporothrix hazakensis]